MITTLHGDCRQVLATMPERSAQCVVSSPPYYGLRKYSDDPREIGQEAAPDCLAWARREPPCGACYVCAMRDVFAQLWRVLRDDGVVFLNLGDSYAGSWGNYGGQNRGKGTQREITKGSQIDNPAYDDTATWRPPTANKIDGIKGKDLLGIPWRVALALQSDGWYLRSDIVWAKPNCMPESVTDRPTRAHEYVFLLAKSARYFYDAAAVREAHAPESMKKNGIDPETGKGYTVARSAAPDVYGVKEFTGNMKQGAQRSMNPAGRNRRTVWSIATQPYSGAHYATMPEALIEPCVLAGSRADDTVLDMFAGSGTVGRVALRLQRRAVLIELNAQYIAEHIDKRTDGLQVEMFV